ncbi:MAG: isocitrate lyase/phosphoenolpyruvate mutase family protein [Actinomycetota bacterium]
MEPTPPVSAAQQQRAASFRRLHEDGIFVMPCAWDAGSARLLAAAGFEAIGTTSGGVNWSGGRRDYVYATPRAVMLDAYAAVAGAVPLPVSGDLENGYGDTPEQVADTIGAAIAAGMVGGSIEDQSSASGPGLLPPDDAAARIAAARSAADTLLPDFVLTARAESYFGGVTDPFADAVDRANRYVEAGADCVFVPGPADGDTVSRLVSAVDAPISIGVGSGGSGLDLDALRRLGVRRVSTGGALPRALYGHLRGAVAEILADGTFGFTDGAVPEAEINDLMG